MGFCIKDIKDLTPVRGQDEKISDTQGIDFWSPTRLRLFTTSSLFFLEHLADELKIYSVSQLRLKLPQTRVIKMMSTNMCVSTRR